MNKTALVACLALLSLPGCRMHQSDNHPYQTVGTDPHRDTESARRHTNRARPLLADGRLEEAEKALKAALSADPFYGPAHHNLGIAYYRQKRFYLAAWEFQYAAQLMPQRPDPRNSLGMVLEYAGRLQEAEKNYAEAAALDPDNVEYLGNLARCRIRLGQRTPEVRQMLQRLLLQDSRPDWVDWARRELMTMPADEDSPPTTQPLVPPAGPVPAG